MLRARFRYGIAEGSRVDALTCRSKEAVYQETLPKKTSFTAFRKKGNQGNLEGIHSILPNLVLLFHLRVMHIVEYQLESQTTNHVIPVPIVVKSSLGPVDPP